MPPTNVPTLYSSAYGTFRVTPAGSPLEGIHEFEVALVVEGEKDRRLGRMFEHIDGKRRYLCAGQNVDEDELLKHVIDLIQ